MVDVVITYIAIGDKKHVYTQNSYVCVQCRSVLNIVPFEHIYIFISQQLSSIIIVLHMNSYGS